MNYMFKRGRWRRIGYCLIVSALLLMLLRFFSSPRLAKGIWGIIDTASLDKTFCKQSCDNMGFDIRESGSIKIGRYLNISNLQRICPLHYAVEKSMTASVILVFHHSVPSMLLRALFSILHRSPDDQLMEVIITTDAPGRDFVLKDLEYYMRGWQMVERVRVVTTTEIVGAQRLQENAIREAKAKILVVLDSLVEVTDGWLSPLLDSLQADSSAIVLPAIEAVHPDTYAVLLDTKDCYYLHSFNWFLQVSNECFLPSWSTDRVWSHISTPHVFAMHKSRFWKLGGYDPESPAKTEATLELSFKAWMCGGSIEVIPCSRIGRVARKSNDQSTIRSASLTGNLRVAAVWMDEYAEFVFDRVGLKHASYGNIDNQIWLRKQLDCNRFKWYLETVATSVKLPDKMRQKGQVINRETNLCLSFPHDFEIEDEVQTQECHNSGHEQFWMLSFGNQLRHDEGCLQVFVNFDSVVVSKCADMAANQIWSYTKERQLFSESRRKCLAVTVNKRIQLEACTISRSQQWIFTS